MKKHTIWISAAAAGALAIGGATAAVAATGSEAATPSATGSAATPIVAGPAASGSGDSRLDAAIQAALAAAGPGDVVDADADDDGTYEVDIRRNAGGVVEVELDSSLKVVSTEADDRSDDGTPDADDDTGRDADDRAVSAADRARASDAALARVGSGRVVEVEHSDDADHAWEVEVRSGDREVEVELAADFSVTAVDRD